MRISAILSLAGALSAGSAAAVVNNEVLSNSGAGTDAGVTIGASVKESATQVYSRTLTSNQVMFQIRDAGSVTLDTAGGALTVVSATANPGWLVIDSKVNAAAEAVVTFQHDDDVLEFTAHLVDGAVVTTVDANSSAASGDTAGTGTVGTRTSANSNGVSGNGSNATDVSTDGTAADGTDDVTGDDDCDGAVVAVCVDVAADAEVNDD